MSNGLVAMAVSLSVGIFIGLYIGANHVEPQPEREPFVALTDQTDRILYEDENEILVLINGRVTLYNKPEIIIVEPKAETSCMANPGLCANPNQSPIILSLPEKNNGE